MKLGYALDDNGFEDNGLNGLVLRAARDAGDLLGDILAFDDFAEDGVLAGEPIGGDCGDEELAAVGAGAGVGHRQFAGLVELMARALGLILETITGATHAGAGRIATLNHEVGNDAMEDGAVVELVLDRKSVV